MGDNFQLRDKLSRLQEVDVQGQTCGREQQVDGGEVEVFGSGPRMAGCKFTACPSAAAAVD